MIELHRDGYEVLDGYLSGEECRKLLGQIAAYREAHRLTEIHRPTKGRPLRYKVIDGEQIQQHLPDIWSLYTGRVLRHVESASATRLEPLGNLKAGVNVNIMQPGRSSYRWHYDRTRFTSILYLNEVEGGETELYPNYRILLGDRSNLRLQRALDRLIQFAPLVSLIGDKVRVAPQAGRLVTMRADRCWHSVSAVRGEHERINLILAYDLPGAAFPTEAGLDSYLYTQEQQSSDDPNYG